MLAPQFGELLRPQIVSRLSADPNNPSLGDKMQPSTESSVVLPLPDGPISSANSPLCSVRSTPLSACTFPAPSPRNLTTPRASMTGSLIG
jgi:hypothetical protein